MAWLEFQTASGGAIIRRQLFTASGTWTKPDKLVGDQVFITAIGGGSSGNSSDNALSGSSGEVVVRFPVDVSGAASETVTIGAGGSLVNGAGTNTAGNTGSTTSFGALVSVAGGAAPSSYYSYVTAITGMNPGSLSFSNSGSASVSAIPMMGAPVGFAGIAFLVGGSGLLLDASGIKAGESGVSDAQKGFPGQGYGAGGAAAGIINNSDDSGAGAPGAVLVEWMEKV